MKDQHSERALLASLCQFGFDAYSEVSYVTSECFEDQQNALVFDMLKKIIETGAQPDISLILSAANEMGFGAFFEKPEELGYLRSLFNLPVKISNVNHYAVKLKKIYLLKKLKMTNAVIKQSLDKATGDESIEELLGFIEQPLSDILNSAYNINNEEPESIFEEMEDHIYRLMDDNTKYTGLKTGIEAYDSAIGGGLRRGSVDVIAGRPKAAKSSCGLQIAINLANQGIPVLIVDTEMTIDGIRNRSIANQSGINVNEITSAAIKNKQDKFKRVIRAAQEKQGLPIYHINVSGRDFKKILAIIKKWIMKYVGRDSDGRLKDCLIVYDYLKLTTSEDISKNMQEYQVLGFQMTELYNFMVKNDCPCLAFVQLNRDMDVSQSDRIKWLCTSFTKFLHKSDEEMADDIAAREVPYNRKMEVECSRWGPGTEHGNYINIRVKGEFARIEPGPTRNELQQRTNFEPPDISTCGTGADTA
jgi:replicative DNA helicase